MQKRPYIFIRILPGSAVNKRQVLKLRKSKGLNRRAVIDHLEQHYGDGALRDSHGAFIFPKRDLLLKTGTYTFTLFDRDQGESPDWHSQSELTAIADSNWLAEDGCLAFSSWQSLHVSSACSEFLFAAFLTQCWAAAGILTSLPEADPMGQEQLLKAYQ